MTPRSLASVADEDALKCDSDSEDNFEGQYDVIEEDINEDFDDDEDNFSTIYPGEKDDGAAEMSNAPTWQAAIPAQFSVGKGPDASTTTESKSSTSQSWSIYKDLPILEAIIGKDSGPWIRLLKLQPGAMHDAIHCDLIRRPLFDAPTYSALSYAWSSGLNDIDTLEASGEWAKAILVGKQNTPFFVSQHLWKALIRLRISIYIPVFLWIDAICIDQGNLLERAAQVNIMAQIYNLADEVRIWLGEHSRFNYDQVTDDGLITMLCQDTRPWWHRLWILQECAYARKCPVVMIGPISMDLRDLMDRWTTVITSPTRGVPNIGRGAIIMEPHARDLIDRRAAVTTAHTRGALNIERGYAFLEADLELLRVPYDLWRAQVEHNRHRMPLLHRLRETLNRQCTEPHDRLFALLSIVDEKDARMVQPDYRKPFPELWLHTVRTLQRSALWEEEDERRFCCFEPISKALLMRVEPSEYREALVAASRSGCLAIVSELVANAAQHGGLVAHHRPAYLAAVENDQRPVAMYLLQEGAAFREQFAYTYAESLAVAAEVGHVEMYETLLHVVQEYINDTHFYSTALNSAFRSLQVDIAQMLIRRGGLRSTEHAYNLAEWIIEKGFGDACSIALLTMLVPALVNMKDAVFVPRQPGEIYTPRPSASKAVLLAFATGRSALWALQILFHHNFHVGAPASAVEAAMIMAHSTLAVGTMERAITDNPAIAWCQPQGLLQYAVEDNNVELVRILFVNGARMHERLMCDDEDTALELAARKGHHGIIVVMLRHVAATAKDTALCRRALLYACRNGHLLAVQALIDGGVGIGTGSDRYSDPLSAALYYGHIDIADLLIQHGAKQISSARQLMATDTAASEQRWLA